MAIQPTEEPGTLETDSVLVRTMREDDLEAVVSIDATTTGRRRPRYFELMLQRALKQAALQVSLSAEMEGQVLSAQGVEGVILRYGYLYGPGTAYAADGSVADLVRGRQFPIAGGGSGVFSFVHVDDAASATVSALESGQPGIYNVVDDEPAPLRD